MPEASVSMVKSLLNSGKARIDAFVKCFDSFSNAAWHRSVQTNSRSFSLSVFAKVLHSQRNLESSNKTMTLLNSVRLVGTGHSLTTNFPGSVAMPSSETMRPRYETDFANKLWFLILVHLLLFFPVFATDFPQHHQNFF